MVDFVVLIFIFISVLSSQNLNLLGATAIEDKLQDVSMVVNLFYKATLATIDLGHLRLILWLPVFNI